MNAKDFAEQLNGALLRHEAGVVDQYKAMIARAAPIGEGWRAVAKSMMRIGELDAAEGALDLLARHRGGTRAARYEQGRELARMGRFDQAWSIVRALPPGESDQGAEAYFLGKLAVIRGESALAGDLFRSVLETDPLSGKAWLALAKLGALAGAPDLRQRMDAAASRFAGAGERERVRFKYAVGRARHDMGDFAGAFAAFSEGAEVMARLTAFDPGRDADEADKAVSGYSREAIEAISAQVTVDTRRAIIVTGLPRSGTTLVEQILSSHSAVSDGGELDSLLLVARKAGGVDAGALSAWIASSGSADVLASLYLHLIDQRFGPGGRIVDKSLEASRYLGAAASLLPQAPIVWIRREPLDCAWSAFSTFFESDVPWSWDLSAIAGHFRLEDRLLDAWRDVLGDRLMVLRYESLVAAPQSEIPKLLAHCGLAIEPAVFSPHLTKRHVATESATQVRRPINEGAIGAAAPYLDYMGAFTASYRTDVGLRY